MKAAYIERTGPPESIVFGELPMPVVGAHDVLVRTTAVAVNHIDTYVRSGAYPQTLPLPFIVGRDLVGVVAEVGSEVENFCPGERVWSNCLGIDSLQGTTAEYVAAPAARLFHLPEDVDGVEAVASLHSGLTAAIGLLDKARIAAGDYLFINGGSGSVGSAVLQVAKACGAHVAVTAGSAEKQAWCQQQGADRVIDYRAENIEHALVSFAPRGIDVYWEATAGFDPVQALAVLAPGGRIVLIAGLDRRSEFPAGTFYKRNATLYGFTVTGRPVADVQRLAGRINQWLAEGVLRAQVQALLPLAEAAAAHRLQESGKLSGKIVLLA